MEIDKPADDVSSVERFYSLVCQSTLLLKILLSVEILIVILSVMSLPFNDPGSAGRNIIYLNIIINFPILASILVVIYLCGRSG